MALRIDNLDDLPLELAAQAREQMEKDQQEHVEHEIPFPAVDCKSTLARRVAAHVWRMKVAAKGRYRESFDSDLFEAATESRAKRFANRLMKTALTLCGEPIYPLSARWDENALRFFAEFTEWSEIPDETSENTKGD